MEDLNKDNKKVLKELDLLSDELLHKFITHCETAAAEAKTILLQRALGKKEDGIDLQDIQVLTANLAENIAGQTLVQEIKHSLWAFSDENMVEQMVVQELKARLSTFHINGYPQTFPEKEDVFDPKKPVAFRNPDAGKVIQFMGEWGDGKLSFEVAYGNNKSVIETRYANGRRFRTRDDWADIVNIKPEAQPQTGTRHRPKS